MYDCTHYCFGIIQHGFGAKIVRLQSSFFGIITLAQPTHQVQYNHVEDIRAEVDIESHDERVLTLVKRLRDKKLTRGLISLVVVNSFTAEFHKVDSSMLVNWTTPFFVLQEIWSNW